MDLSVDTIKILLFLAPGFLAFRLYMIDSVWREIRHLDVVYGSLVFSTLGYSCYLAFAFFTGLEGPLWLVAVALFSSVALAVIWRKYGHPIVHGLLSRMGITNEDNLGDVWQKIFNDPRIYVTQITAYLKNGEAIDCDETEAFDRQDLRGKGIFSYYAHRDRQLCFVPTARRRSADAEWEPVEDVEAEGWGVRMVYINPDELQRLEVRVAPSG